VPAIDAEINRRIASGQTLRPDFRHLSCFAGAKKNGQRWALAVSF
jgi:hypothetical protein